MEIYQLRQCIRANQYEISLHSQEERCEEGINPKEPKWITPSQRRK